MHMNEEELFQDAFGPPPAVEQNRHSVAMKNTCDPISVDKKEGQQTLHSSGIHRQALSKAFNCNAGRNLRCADKNRCHQQDSFALTDDQIFDNAFDSGDGGKNSDTNKQQQRELKAPCPGDDRLLSSPRSSEHSSKRPSNQGQCQQKLKQPTLSDEQVFFDAFLRADATLGVTKNKKKVSSMPGNYVVDLSKDSEEEDAITSQRHMPIKVHEGLRTNQKSPRYNIVARSFVKSPPQVDRRGTNVTEEIDVYSDDEYFNYPQAKARRVTEDHKYPIHHFRQEQLSQPRDHSIQHVQVKPNVVCQSHCVVAAAALSFLTQRF